MARSTPSYGTPNWDMISRWLHLAPDEDGAFWALNLMRYRPVADYGDEAPAASGVPVSGRAADDAYAPLGPLAAIGAMVAFHGDVLDQPLGDPAWDRIGIVRYPSRAAFFAMQQREDFKQQHVHKEAGMEFTIVMACQPVSSAPIGADAGTLVLVVERGAVGGAAVRSIEGVVPVADFSVEGVIVGDERTFDRARFVRIANDAALDALVSAAATSEDAHVVVVDPGIDHLIESIDTAAPAVEA